MITLLGDCDKGLANPKSLSSVASTIPIFLAHVPFLTPKK